MTPRGFVEDDELIQYAMQALMPSEAASVERELAASEPIRQRLAEIRLALGVYAEAVVEPVVVPERSLDRLMSAIAADRKVVQMPAPSPGPARKGPRPSLFTAFSWGGWAVAAAMLVVLGLQFQRARTARQQAEQTSAQVASVSHERDSLQQALQQQTQQREASLAELASARAQANQLSERVSAESQRAAHESARAADLAGIASANAQESARLKGAIASQDAQVAQLNAQAANARQVQDALSDPTALRVTLTVPKQKKVPTGRGTYVPGKGTLLFTASDLAPLPANKVYELWILPAEGNPIPAGTFRPDAAGSATVVSTTFQRQIAAKGFAITAEPAGGSTTPTMPILLAGT